MTVHLNGIACVSLLFCLTLSFTVSSGALGAFCLFSVCGVRLSNWGRDLSLLSPQPLAPLAALSSVTIIAYCRKAQ